MLRFLLAVSNSMRAASSAKLASCSNWSYATAVLLDPAAGNVVVAPSASVVVIEGPAWGAGMALERVPATSKRATCVLRCIFLQLLTREGSDRTKFDRKSRTGGKKGQIFGGNSSAVPQGPREIFKRRFINWHMQKERDLDNNLLGSGRV